MRAHVPGRIIGAALAALAAAILALAPTASAARIAGVDPEVEPIPGKSFACYLELAGDSYATPAFVLQTRPGRRYSTPYGDGTFAIDPAETLSITWTSGPLAGDAIESSVLFDDWGQRLTVRIPDAEFECYQSGARRRVAMIDFGLKDPAAASYRCVERDSGAKGPTIELTAGRTYRLDGAAGTYTADITGDFGDDFSSLEFTSGPIAGQTAFYEQDGETGLRELSLFTSPRLECRSLGKPSPRPRFGPGKAPRPPRGSGGLNGLYAAYQVDVANLCGGLCWRFLFFKKNGYVYTREPGTGLSDANCARRKPNGLPVCETYRRRGSRITIGNDPARSFSRSGKRLKIAGSVYRPVAPAAKLKLRGRYRSFRFTPNPGASGGVGAGSTFTFTTSGRFTRQGFVGATFAPLPGDPGASVVTTSSNANAGRYRVIKKNTLEFRFKDGSRKRVFFFLPDGPTRSTRPKSIRIAGTDYLPR